MTLGRVHDHAPAAAVGEALRVIPETLLELTACEFIVGVDPVFANIHRYVEFNGYRYRDVAHCVSDYHQLHRPRCERGTKVVLPSNPGYGWDGWQGVRTVVHELGHVLHGRVGENHVADPVSEYARTNHYEAFAEAFAAWVWGEQVGERTEALFAHMAHVGRR